MATILVVDDEEPVRTAVRQVLERAGYGVLDAPDGQAAMGLVRDHAVDLVITDLIMPERDGIEMIAWMRANSPDTKIIAISGGGWYSLTGLLNVAQLMGAQRAFTKPISPRELLAAVQELLGEPKT